MPAGAWLDCGRSSGLPHGPAECRAVPDRTPGLSWASVACSSLEREDRSAALIIASDAGRGFSGPKYLARQRKVPLLQGVLSDAHSWPVDEVFVVLGADAEAVLRGVDFGSSVIVIDPEWAEGDAASLRVGLDALSRDRSMRLAVLARGDQLGVDAEMVQRLLDERLAARAVVAVPKYRYARGWPIVVAEDLWPRLMGLEGDVDIQNVLAGHPAGVVECWFDRLAPPRIEDGADLGR